MEEFLGNRSLVEHEHINAVVAQLVKEHMRKQTRDDTLKVLQAEFGAHIFKSRRSLRSFITKHKVVDAAKSIYTDTITLDNQALVSQLERMDKELSRALNRNQLIVDTQKTLIKSLPPPSVKPLVLTRSKSDEDLCLLLSDVHVGSCVRKTETSNISEYNMEIFQTRLDRMISGMYKIYDKEVKDHKVPNINVFALGDMVDNETIYQGQPYYIDRTLMDQLYQGSFKLAAGFASLAKYLPIQLNFYTVNGNHGRPGMRGANHLATNWDYVFYKCMESCFKGWENVHFHISDSPTQVFKLRDKVIALDHGAAVKGAMSIPFYGLEREKRGIQSMMRTNIDIMCVGDKHRRCSMDVDFDQILMNGSFVGGSQLSTIELRSACLPKQLLFGLHDKYGITGQWDLYLDDKKPMPQDKDGIFTPVAEKHIIIKENIKKVWEELKG